MPSNAVGEVGEDADRTGHVGLEPGSVGIRARSHGHVGAELVHIGAGERQDDLGRLRRPAEKIGPIGGPASLSPKCA